jgi:hypothetical protein
MIAETCHDADIACEIRYGCGKFGAEQQGKPVVREQAAHTRYCRIERDKVVIKIYMECRLQEGGGRVLKDKCRVECRNKDTQL